MVVELGDDDVGEKTRACPPAGDRMVRRRGLHHRLAKAAGERLAHVTHHLEAAWHVVEGLGHVGADPPQSTAAVRTAAGGGMDNLLARQVFGQRPSCRLDGLFDCRPEHLGDSGDSCDPLRMVLIQRLNRQLELLNGAIDSLRGATKLSALEPGKLESKLLDLGTRRNRIPRQFADDALERINVIRQSGRIDRHATALAGPSAASPRQPRA